MTNQRQTDSVLASPSPNGHSRRNETSGRAEAAGIPRQGSTYRGMTDQPFDRPSTSSSRSGTAGGFRRWRRFIRRVPLIDRTLAAYYCARDPETPLHARGALLFAIAYFIMPFDLIPDFIPVVAHLDDAAVFLLALRLVGHRITPEHRARAGTLLDQWAG